MVPVLERLFHAKFGRGDGCGALILSPTRELAMQIFEVCNSMCCPCDVALSDGCGCRNAGVDEGWACALWLVCGVGGGWQRLWRGKGCHCIHEHHCGHARATSAGGMRSAVHGCGMLSSQSSPPCPVSLQHLEQTPDFDVSNVQVGV